MDQDLLDFGLTDSTQSATLMKKGEIIIFPPPF